MYGTYEKARPSATTLVPIHVRNGNARRCGLHKFCAAQSGWQIDHTVPIRLNERPWHLKSYLVTASDLY